MNETLRIALEDIVENLVGNLKEDLKARWNALDIVMEKKEVYEVQSGLLARQITLAIQFAQNFNCWTYDIAPLILRCMTDNYINFAWIAKDAEVRSKQFILYGLGQEKLQVEHLKNELNISGQNPELELMIKYREEWINSHRYSFLTEVNIGSWSGISTRKMAEEADCLDFYNFVYTPFSTAAHNMWGHIARYNLQQSNNPLHKNLYVPFLGDISIDLHNVVLAAKYTDKMIKKFDELFLLNIDKKSSYEQLYAEFAEFENTYRNQD
jgi:hypothetical protein